MFSSIPTKQSRTSRACEGCRRRKVKCSGGTVCDGCIKFNESCVYRQHYRALKEYPIKIVHNPAERCKRRKSSSASEKSSTSEKSSPVDIQRPVSSSPDLFNPIIFTPPMLSNGTTYEDPLLPPLPTPNSHSIALLIREIICSSSHKLASPPSSHSSITPSSPMEVSPPNQDQMLECLKNYFTLIHPNYPMLDPESWYRKSKTAWIAIEYGSILSFNQIELAIIYILVALGSRESAHTKHWAHDYLTKAKKIIPNVAHVPMCLNISQYALLLSMYEIQENQSEALMLSETAIQTAVSLGLQTLVDTSKYADLPGLNALESHRTYICAYMWNQLLALATNQSTQQTTQASLSERAFMDIGHDSTFLSKRLSMLQEPIELPIDNAEPLGNVFQQM